MSIKKHIPNCITSLNLACGTAGVVFALQGRVDVAFPLMICAALFDFLDGTAARLLGAYSDMGKELDSLSDMVSFGVLPAAMMYNLMKTCTFSSSAWCMVPLLIAVFSGLRLAKFNVDERQHMSFIGLATPVCAMLCGSLCYYVAFEYASPIAALCGGYVFVPVLSLLLCALLVSEVPMFSLKFSAGDPAALRFKRISFLVEIIVIVALVLAFGANWSLAVTLGCLLYIIKNVFYAIFKV